MSDAESSQNLADRQAITDLIYRYCRSMDRIDAELGYSIWHEDATADYEGYYTGQRAGLHRRRVRNAPKDAGSFPSDL